MLYKQNQKLSTGLGLILLILAIPLFALHIFFTAERFTWYAAGFFLLAVIQVLKKYHENRN
jgi:hypothetical protein